MAGGPSTPALAAAVSNAGGLDAKLEIVCHERPPITSFTFGCPSTEVIQRLHERDIAVWVTVTEVDEALLAAGAGADALIVQGVEAGGHRGSFADTDFRYGPTRTRPARTRTWDQRIMSPLL